MTARRTSTLTTSWNNTDNGSYLRFYIEPFVQPRIWLTRRHWRNFRASYSYYYFLGMFLAKHRAECADIVELMCNATYLPSNYLTLLFLIHHTESREVIDEILLRTLCALEGVEPARLDRAETRRFQQIVGGLPKNVLSGE